jgi:DNA-directed RNA polymerase omega subunit
MENKVKLSRGPNIDMDACVRNMDGNRFNLILASAARAREITKRNRALGKLEHECTPVSALRDVQVGLVKTDYLRKVR